MKKILLIFLLFAMVTSIYSDQTDLDKDISLARKIFQTEKEKHSCILSPKETEDAAKSYLKLENITTETLSETAQMMTKLIAGLRLVVEGKEDPDWVYSTLKLNSYNIAYGNWRYYLNNYKSSQKINSLERWIPDNDEILIKSASKNVKPVIEHWLLEQYILNDFNTQMPQMSNLAPSQKLTIWWNNKLEEYDLGNHDKKIILNFLKQRASISTQHAEFWNIFLKNVLNLQKESIRILKKTI